MFNSAIFAVSTLLLVPFLYYASSSPYACAEPPAQGFRDSQTCAAPTTNSKGVTVQTCCWKEREYPKIGDVTYCQTCYSDKVGETWCGDKEKQAMKTGTTRPQLEGGILEESTSPNSNQSFGLKAGSVFQGQNLTLAQANFSSDSNNTLAQLQTDEESDTSDNTEETEAEVQKGSNAEENGDDPDDTEDENND